MPWPRIGVFILLAACMAALCSAEAFAGSEHPPRVVYLHDESAYTLSVSGGGSRQIEAREASSYSWSHDGRYLLVQVGGRHPRLVILSPSGRYIRQLPVEISTVFAYGWDQDTDSVLFGKLVSLPPCHHGRCPERVWPVFYRVRVRGAAWLMWPHRLPKGARPVAAGAGLSAYPKFGDPALSALKGELLTSEASLLFSSRQRVIVFAKGIGSYASRPWRVLDLRTGTHRQLPFGDVKGPLGVSGLFDGGPVDAVMLSSKGELAGQVGGRVAVMPLRARRHWRAVGWGYAPVWSPDGRYLYYVASRRMSKINFEMRVEEPAIFSCVHKGKLDLSRCGAQSQPYRKVWLWQPVQSAVNEVSVRRASAAGYRPVTLFSETGYGIADVNALPGNGRIIFSAVPSDAPLYLRRNRHGRVDAANASLYRPYIGIQSWTVGSSPVLLVDHARLPAVQP